MENAMPVYQIKTSLDQIVTKKISLEVEANTEEEAEAKAIKVLHQYPDPVTVEGVSKVLVVAQQSWIPRTVDVISVKQKAVND